MNGQNFLDKISLVDFKFIEEAEKQTNITKVNFAKWAAAAASVAIALFAGAKALPYLSPSNGISPVTSDFTSTEDNTESAESKVESTVSGTTALPPSTKLPMIYIPENPFGGMSFEAYLAYDISELTNKLPPISEETTSLPVYKNPVKFEADSQLAGGDIQEMKATLIVVFDRLGIEEGDIEWKSVSTKQVTGTCNGISVEVTPWLSARIDFETAIALPEEYDFSDSASYEELERVGEYLKESYAELIGDGNSTVNVVGNGRDFYGNRRYRMRIVCGGASEALANYHFRQIAFLNNSEGKLSAIALCPPSLPEKVGEYPIISAKEAEEYLLSGEYYTTSQYEVKGKQSIKKTELVYFTGEFAEYSIPFFKFYVELDDAELPDYADQNLKTYGIYYVPAISREYVITE